MSFSEIAKLPQEQQDAITGEMTGKEKIFYGRWYARTANQRKMEEKTGYEAANQRLQEQEARLQAAIDRIMSQIPQVIPVYESRIAK